MSREVKHKASILPRRGVLYVSGTVGNTWPFSFEVNLRDVVFEWVKLGYLKPSDIKEFVNRVADFRGVPVPPGWANEKETIN